MYKESGLKPMQGKLIVIDGLDGSGKSTQAEAVYKTLSGRGEQVLMISYPDYKNPSSTLVRMYLNGEFSSDAMEVNAYAASSFYAVDRYAGYLQHWGEYYRRGYTILASRYVSSNAIHQMVKLPFAEWDDYLAWLDDYEYGKLLLPKPDRVIFLDMDRNAADKLIASRYKGDLSKRDIHEQNLTYLEQCQKTAHYAAKKQDWRIVSCSDGDKPYPVSHITNKILEAIEGL